MPGLRPTTPEQLQAGQRWLKENIRPPESVAMNVGVAANMAAPLLFVFRNRMYRVPMLSYRDGIQLQELYIELAKAADDGEETREQLEDLAKLCDRAAVMFPTLCEPKNGLVRFLWRRGWLRNPFLKATTSELAQLLGFFLQCRTKSSVQLLGSLAHRPALASSTRRTS